MIVVEDGLHLYLRLVGKHITTVSRIFIDRDITILSQFEDIGKQINLLALRLYGVVESGILILREINLAVDVATPNHFLRHIEGRGERDLRPHAHARRGTLLLLLLLLLFCLLLIATLFRLSKRIANG